jgi:hypothetical protein
VPLFLIISYDFLLEIYVTFLLCSRGWGNLFPDISYPETDQLHSMDPTEQVLYFLPDDGSRARFQNVVFL